MSLEHLHVVHVGLPVLHVTAVIRRQHPHVVMRPRHRTHRTVVSLQGTDRTEDRQVRGQTGNVFCTGVQCMVYRWRFTCKMVSKLKVSPFHRVNSPLEAPVTRRRPSGVHCRQTGRNGMFFTIKAHRQCHVTLTGSDPEAYPDHKHGTLDFVGGGSNKLGGDGVHRVV